MADTRPAEPRSGPGSSVQSAEVNEGVEESGLAVPGMREDAQRAFLAKVFGWMFLGLLVTAGVAAWFSQTVDMETFVADNPFVFFGAIIGQLVLVIALVAMVNRMAPALAMAMFLLYSGLTGFVFSMIISGYTTGSIASTFAITAGMFGAMALFGFVTKRDLSSLGSILFMALIGFIIASIVNLIWFNETIYWVLTGIGILIFCGLTAYDMQKLKEIGAGEMDEEASDRAAVVGALALYLDFINLFLLLLRIFGRSR